VCRQAKYNGVETNIQLDRIKPKEVKVDKIYLTFNELDKIEKLNKQKLREHLLNARDWLIISSYTGQRVSDFMRFHKKQIRIENDKPLIEFTQKKTGKIMTIPLHSKILNILKKRKGDFPKAISSQKYNDYIKKVCEIAKINEKVRGSKLIKLEEKNINYSYRKQIGKYEKWELVTSHIGRRSFASNFYGQIPTSFLIYITGHSTEKMFLNYIGKSNKDLALEMTKYF
jgi:integrase